MSIEITKLGIIKGGNCERWFKARGKREMGVRLAIDWLLNHNCVDIHKGFCKIVKVPKKLYSTRWVIDNICHFHGGDAEIGWHRFISEVARPLYVKGESFRLNQLKKWGADKAALEFALTASVRSHKFCYSKPHRDEIYKKWKNFPEPQENR